MSTKRLSPLAALENLRLSHPHLVFPTLSSLDPTTFNNRVPLAYFCTLCKLEGLSPKSYKDMMRTKIGCSRCSGTGKLNKKTTEVGKAELVKRFPILLDTEAFDISELYIDSSVKPVVGIKCLRHPNHTIRRTYNEMMSMTPTISSPCQECNIEARSKSLVHGKDIFMGKAGNDLEQNHNLSFQDFPEIFYDKTSLPVYCLNHDEPFLFYKRPNDLKNGQLCPKCSQGKHFSNAELELIDYIRSLGVFCLADVALPKIRWRLDALIPSKDSNGKTIAIEFNGDYYHSDKFKSKFSHSERHDYCKKIGIELIQIFENEWLNKKDLIKKRLRSVLGVDDRIYARKCEVRREAFKDVSAFLEKHHLQGKGNPTGLVYAAYYNEELVAVMTFGKIRFEKERTSDDSYELLRYCSSCTVVGGFSRLLRAFEQDIRPKRVVSYSHKTWGWGNVYDVNGFTWVSASDPGYFWSKGQRILTRFQSQKHLLLELWPEFKDDPYATEDSIMKAKGYLRVWDCGNDKWEKRY